MKLNPHQFRDTLDRVWSIDVNVGHYMKIRDDYGIDITDMSDTSTSWITTLSEDMVTFCSILAELTEKQRTSRNVSLEEFFEALGGDVLSCAVDAVLAGVVNFTPAHRRLAFSKILEKMKQGQEMVGQKMVEAADKIDMSEIETKLDQKIASAQSKSTT